MPAEGIARKITWEFLKPLISVAAFNNGFRDSGNGEKHGYRKLKPEDKKAIKTRYNKRTCTRKELAKEYNVTTASIDRILYLWSETLL